ncbi:class I SAM-dependent methyltransferase [Polyangium sp. y55x31]|uniref:class I SAM-dependent methyltransferase n=1 Tax=Polyangium sp. y55x31 TaxID=3042688 RepID=UPI002483018E|nr:class I SAM-dependent methyltransferase [Polyangium sp. y55x31]MDI1480987.1 methyltransferase domain-containing protein [Polyangium sp. y55x31]
MASEGEETRDRTAAPEPSAFYRAYEEGVHAPWDIGRPQSDIVALAEAGGFRGDVLDVGCGPGDNAIFLAARGHVVTGLDMVENALSKARTRAQRSGVSVQFVHGNALELDMLGRTFDTVLDSGLLHVFGSDMRPRYVESLSRVVRPGGMYYALVWSDKEPGGEGPRRLSEAEIRAAFSSGWNVREIRPARYEHMLGGKGYAEAWLVSIERAG